MLESINKILKVKRCLSLNMSDNKEEECVPCNPFTFIYTRDSDDPHTDWKSIENIYPYRDKEYYIQFMGVKSLIFNHNFFKMFAFDMINIDSKNGCFSYKQEFLFNNTQMFEIMKYLFNSNRLCDCKHDVNNYHQRNRSMIQCAIICDNNDVDIKKDINYYRNYYCSCVENLSNDRFSFYCHTCPCHYLYVVIDEQRDKGCCDNDDTDKKRIYMDDYRSISKFYETP